MTGRKEKQMGDKIKSRIATRAANNSLEKDIFPLSPLSYLEKDAVSSVAEILASQGMKGYILGCRADLGNGPTDIGRPFVIIEYRDNIPTGAHKQLQRRAGETLVKHASFPPDYVSDNI
jgi:hypothetical protein